MTLFRTWAILSTTLKVNSQTWSSTTSKSQISTMLAASPPTPPPLQSTIPAWLTKTPQQQIGQHGLWNSNKINLVMIVVIGTILPLRLVKLPFQDGSSRRKSMITTQPSRSTTPHILPGRLILTPTPLDWSMSAKIISNMLSIKQVTPRLTIIWTQHFSQTSIGMIQVRATVRL